MSEVKTISPHELTKNIQENSTRLIDVRTPAEFREVHVKGAKNVPLDKLDPNDLASDAEGRELFVICKSGARGKIAAERLKQIGFVNVRNVEGGTEACIVAGVEVERGKKVMSIERQVRIIAGLIVFVGALLALTINISFALVPVFVGAGLVFAGVTDTCGMAYMLGKCPWNQ